MKNVCLEILSSTFQCNPLFVKRRAGWDLTMVRSLRGGGLCLDPTSVKGKDSVICNL